jgi:uncharacterized membrane protein HdeD (DUF308 family)
LAEIDKQKEKITFWRSLFFFLLASIFGLVAFIFTKYSYLNDLQLILSNIAGLLLLIGIISVALKLKKEIEKIGDM